MIDATARMVEAEAAKQAWDRFIAPALYALRADYMAKLCEHAERPMEGRTLQVVQNMSLALRITREVEGQLKAIIVDGEVAQADANRARKVADMSPEGRKWASY